MAEGSGLCALAGLPGCWAAITRFGRGSMGIKWGRLVGPRCEIPAKANEWMVDEKPAPNRKDVWMDEDGRCACACSSGKFGVGRGREKRITRRG